MHKIIITTIISRSIIISGIHLWQAFCRFHDNLPGFVSMANVFHVKRTSIGCVPLVSNQLVLWSPYKPKHGAIGDNSCLFISSRVSAEYTPLNLFLGMASIINWREVIRLSIWHCSRSGDILQSTIDFWFNRSSSFLIIDATEFWTRSQLLINWFSWYRKRLPSNLYM